MAHSTPSNDGWRRRALRFAGFLPATVLALVAFGGTASASQTSTQHVGSAHVALTDNIFGAPRGFIPSEGTVDGSSADDSSADQSGDSSSDPGNVEDSPSADPTDFTGGDPAEELPVDDQGNQDPAADQGNEEPPTVDEAPPVIDEAPPADDQGNQDPAADQGNEAPPAVDEAPPVIDEAPPAVDEAPPVIDEAPPVVPQDGVSQQGRDWFNGELAKNSQTGQCVAWAMQKRPDLVEAVDLANADAYVKSGFDNATKPGMLVHSDAADWADVAAKNGRPMTKTPGEGDLVVFQRGTTITHTEGNAWSTHTADPAHGHIAYVESVERDAAGNPVSFTVSEMNGAGGVGVVTHQTIQVGDLPADGVDFIK